MRSNQHKVSCIIDDLIDVCAKEKSLPMEKFIEMLGERSFALAILVFSLPNSLPIPGIPGLSTITGFPIVWIGLQMVLGRKSLWLPRRLATKCIPVEKIGKMLEKAKKPLTACEKYLHARWLFMSSKHAERFLGLWFVALALVIMLPIPGGNFLPGLAMTLVAFGMLERDGILIVGALLFAAGSLVFMYELISLFFTTTLKTLGVF